MWRAASGAGKFLAGATRSRRRIPPYFGFVMLGAVLLLIGSRSGGEGSSIGWVWDSFTWPLLQASPGLAILGAIWLVGNRSRVVKVDPVTGVPEELDLATARQAALALIKAQQDVQMKKAERLFPETMSHGQYQVTETRVPPPPPLPASSGPIRVPTFAKLLEVEATEPKIYAPGISASGLLTIDYEKCGPFTVCGLQGTYKTEVLVQAAMQFLWKGGRVALIDPDAGHPQSLTNRLGPLADEHILRYPMGYDEASCRRVMRMIFEECYEACDKNLLLEPLFVAMDEANFTATLAHRETREAFVALTGLMALKLRKRIVTMGMAIQNPTEKKTGNEGLLQTFGWAMSGRVDPRMRGRALRQTNENVPEDIGMLPLDGTFYVFSPMLGEIMKMHIPHSTAGDLHAVHERCLQRLEVTNVRVLNGHGPEELVTTQPQPIVGAQRLAIVQDVDTEPDETPDRPLRKMRALHEEGLTPKQIMVECWGEEGKRKVENPGRWYSDHVKMLREATRGCQCGDPLHKEG